MLQSFRSTKKQSSTLISLRWGRGRSRVKIDVQICSSLLILTLLNYQDLLRYEKYLLKILWNTIFFGTAKIFIDYNLAWKYLTWFRKTVGKRFLFISSFLSGKRWSFGYFFYVLYPHYSTARKGFSTPFLRDPLLVPAPLFNNFLTSLIWHWPYENDYQGVCQVIDVSGVKWGNFDKTMKSQGKWCQF